MSKRFKSFSKHGQVSHLESDSGLGPLRGRRSAADDDPRRAPLVHGRVLVEDDGAEAAC